MTEKRKQGYAPREGRKIARTWAVAYGTAWVLSNDLMEPPGVFSDYRKFQVLTRAMERCDIYLERMEYAGNSYLYRLSPEMVADLLYGGSDDTVRSEGP